MYVVDHGANGPIRCNRCKAYMNPYSHFVDGGRQYLCPICQCTNEGTCIYVYIYVHVFMYIYVYMYLCIFVCMYVFISGLGTG